MKYKKPINKIIDKYKEHSTIPTDEGDGGNYRYHFNNKVLNKMSGKGGIVQSHEIAVGKVLPKNIIKKKTVDDIVDKVRKGIKRKSI